ncbi:MAG: hypothetical protein C4524_02570 [Candidatus Zixiibacteriota bacterium]|nr:MAG: hypothetical protein C4524_02570 [candidate division Zixibacteria bacterium]
MSCFFLIRHGATDAIDHRLVGRLQGVHLNSTGRDQAQRLAHRLAPLPLAALISSPMERAVETAAPLAELTRKEIVIREHFTELDFGEWTGLTFGELERTPAWREFNVSRSIVPIPGGEHMAGVQARAMAGLEVLRGEHPEASLAVVTHGDVIRSVLAYCLGISLDLIPRLAVSPGSVNIVRLDGRGPRVIRVNDTGELPGL